MPRTIRELLELVNKEIQSLVGQKLEANDFHYEIAKLVNKHTKREGMEYSVWNIQLKNSFTEIAKLSLETKDDKRTKFNPQWKTLSLEFKVVDENILDLTIDELGAYTLKRRKQQEINMINTSIEKAYANIEKMKLEKEKISKELECLQN